MPGAQGHAAGDLLRRADQHRRLRQDAAEGIQLPAGRDQQPHVVRRQRRHRCSAASSAGCSSRSIAATSPSCRSATTSRADSRLLMRRNIRERVAALAPFLTFDPDPVHRRRRRRPAVVDDGRASRRRTRYPYARHYRLGRERDQLHAQQRQGRHRRLRRHDDVLRVRQRGSDHRRVSRHLPDALQGRVGDAARPAQARALSRSCC